MLKAVFPGTFDPISNGHLNICKRVAKIFEELVILVETNCGKNPLFSLEERLSLAAGATADIPNIVCRTFDGLTTDFMKSNGIDVIVRGIRNSADLEYEMQIASFNQQLMSSCETIFLAPDEHFRYLSSSAVRELVKYHADISSLVPENVRIAIAQKFA